MPYTRSGKCVHKRNADGSPGAVVKCHDDVKQAQAHLEALEANVSDATDKDQKEMRYTQQEVNYRVLSDTPGKACVNCRWYRRWDSTCLIVEEWPDPIVLTGLSDQWEARPEPPEPAPVPVVIVDDQSKASDNPADVPPKPTETPPAPEVPATKSLAERFADWIKATLLETASTKEQAYGFKVHPTGNTWLAWYSTATKDLEDEMFPRKATDEFIERVQKGLEPYPELWMFHAALPIGKAAVIGRQDLITYAAGSFDDTPRAKAFQTWARKQKGDLPVSHGFKFLKALKRDGAYWHYNTFEISPLHPVYQKAANPTAKFSEVFDMTIKPEQIKALADVFGSDELARKMAEEALAAMEKKSKELAAQGMDFKESGEAPAVPVVDADARKELETVKSAQTTAQTAYEALAKSVTDSNQKVVDALAALTGTKEKVDAHEKQLADLTQQVTAAVKQVTDLTARVDQALTLSAPASKSVLSQVLAGDPAFAEAADLQKKNADPAPKPILDQVLAGAPIAIGE